LDSFSTTVGEEECIDVSRRYLSQLCRELATNFSSHEGVRVSERLRLLLDGINHTHVAVSDVYAHQLAVEVDEAFAFRRPEVDAFRGCHRDWIDCCLSGPFEESMTTTKFDDFLA